ncbi:hypothetical protein ACHAP5_009732 [Fusarium lateritium]
MEAVGLAVGLVGLFSTCLEAVQRIDSYKTAGRDSRLLCAQIDATMHLFERWGDSVGIGKGKLSDNHHPALDDPKTFSVVKNLLQSFEEFSTATTTYNATGPKAIQRVPSIPLPNSASQNLSKNSRWQRTGWALRGKLKQTNHVEALATLVSELYSVVPPETAIVASIRQKPLSHTASFKNQHGAGSSQDAVTADQPSVADVRDILLELQQGLRAEALQDLRTWIGSPPPNHLYDESKDRRLKQTCEWMIHRQKFLNWQAPSTSNKLLWIKGPAGFGKTVLCARLVQEVENTPERPMAHFFLSSKFEGRDDPFSAIRSWLTTMISKNPIALDIIRGHHLPDYEQVASQTTILQLFHNVVTKLPGCTFILDGLDECTGMNSTDSKSVSNFLDQLKKAILNTGTRLLISSRADPIIQQGLSSFPGYTDYTILSTDVGPDLGIYSAEVVRTRLSNKDEATREFISQKLQERCLGQFQWVKLQEGSLRPGRNKKQLEKEIDETPSGLDSLYDREWNRIISMGATDKARALCLLRWAAFSLRPLTVYEITEAVLMTEDCEEFPVDEMPDAIDKDYIDSMILYLCGSLIEVRHSPINEVEQKQCSESDRGDEKVDLANFLQQNLGGLDVGMQEVHLSHFSVKEYLLHRIVLYDPDSHLNKTLLVSHVRLENMALSKYCLRYLNLPKAWDDWQMGDKKPTMRFLFYAAAFWIRHYKTAKTPDQKLQDEVNAFFDDQNPSFLSWRSLWETNCLLLSEFAARLLPLGPFEVATLLALKDVVKYIINERNHDLNHHSKHDMSALHYACISGDRDIMEMLVESGAELDTMTDRGYTPLSLAIDCGNRSVVELLISKGADIHLADNHGMTPLHRASQLGHLKIVEQLIEHGAEISTLSKDTYTPLLYAAVSGQSEVVTLLLDKGADSSDADKNGYTSLHLASLLGNQTLVRQLIDRGADFAALSKQGYTPLAAASLSGQTQVVRLLLESDANLHQLNEADFMPLILAAEGGHVEVVKMLLEHGVDWDKENEKGYSSLQSACEKGQSELVKLLLQSGADWRYVGHEGWTSIFLAARNNYIDVVEMLLDEGASFNASHDANGGYSLLHAAAIGGFLDLAKLIIDKGASVEEKGFSSSEPTPLCIASSQGHLEMVKLLLEKGADVNAVSGDLVTPLFDASEMGHYDIAKLLIENGADMSAKTEYDGFTPLMGALDKLHFEICTLLLDSGSPVTSTSDTFLTPLHLAASFGDSRLIKPLLDRGADISAKDNTNDEPIHVAAQAGHLEFIKLLVQEGADATIKDLFGRSALFYAANYGHESLADLWTTETYSQLAVTDAWSRTPLHYACEGGNLHSVKWMLGLLQITSETIDRADYWGSTPLSIAVRKGHTGLVKLLLDTNAVDIDSTDRFGRSLILWATKQGHDEILWLLTGRNGSQDLKTEIKNEELKL